MQDPRLRRLSAGRVQQEAGPDAAVELLSEAEQVTFSYFWNRNVKYDGENRKEESSLTVAHSVS